MYLNIEMVKEYKGYTFRKLYKQWVNVWLGGFKSWEEAKLCVDTIKFKEDRKNDRGRI